MVLQRKYTLWKQCNTPFNEVSLDLIIIVSTWQLFLTKGFHFFQKKLPWSQSNSWNKETRFLQTYNIWTNTRHSWWNQASPLFSCKTFSLKGRIPLLKHYVYFALLFQLYVRHIADMQPYLLPKKSICLLHIFLYHCRMFQSIDSQPCQGT